MGAGLGRQVVELGKLSEAQLGRGVKWTCYEPAFGSRLRERLEGWPNVTVVETLEAIPKRQFDICVLANVLHEVTPPEFLQLLTVADAQLSPTGVLAILELFPLIHPERYAVAYDATTLADILRAAGLVADIAQIPLRGPGVTAYCVIARRLACDRAFDPAAAKQAIDEAWVKILERALSSYAALGRPVDADSY